MILYLTTADAATDKTEVGTWAGTQSDASAQRAQYKRDGLKNVGTNTVDVPTDKQGLIAFLNANKVTVLGDE